MKSRDVLNISVQDLLYLGAVLQNRNAEIDIHHKKQYQKIQDLLDGLPHTAQKSMANTLSDLRAAHSSIVERYSSHSELINNTAKAYQNQDNL